MAEIHPAVLTGVRGITDQLSDDELVALYMATIAGFDPKQVMGYEKAKSLFTKQDGTKMHSDTFTAFERVVSERIP